MFPAFFPSHAVWDISGSWSCVLTSFSDGIGVGQRDTFNLPLLVCIVMGELCKRSDSKSSVSGGIHGRICPFTDFRGVKRPVSGDRRKSYSWPSGGTSCLGVSVEYDLWSSRRWFDLSFWFTFTVGRPNDSSGGFISYISVLLCSNFAVIVS